MTLTLLILTVIDFLLLKNGLIRLVNLTEKLFSANKDLLRVILIFVGSLGKNKGFQYSNDLQNYP